MSARMYQVGGNSTLESYETEHLEAAGVVECWYRYDTEPYEGSGWAVVRFADGEWDALSLLHGSCNGPTEDYHRNTTFPTLDALIAKHSYEAAGEFRDLIAAAREATP